jgi:Fe-S cluster assembly protein SufD
VEVGPNAKLEHVVVQRENTQAFHIGMTHARVARDARYSNRYFGFGAALTRNNITAVFEGEHGETVLEGLYLPTETQHMDHFTVIDHAQPHCESHELYKGILDDSTRAVFSGRIIVRQDAQKTNAKQSNNNLLLSDDAKVNTKPQLEIYADDVKCTHGATVGRLSEDALFYLRSRGIDAAQARGLLAHAFAAELVDRVTIDSMHDILNAQINARLDRSTIS